MKKIACFWVLFLFAVSINFCYATSLDLENEYKSSQTVITSIKGAVNEPLENSNVEFKRNNVIVPINYEIKKISDTYYLWFITPKVTEDTNYTLKIKSVWTYENGENKKINITNNFSVITNISDYYIEPGFIITKDNYSINVNSNLDQNFEIELDFPSRRTISIDPGKNEFEFYTSGIKESIFKIVKIGNYDLPVLIIKNGSVSEIQNNSISVVPSSIYSEREKNTGDLNFKIKITNLGENEIKDIYLEYNSKIFTVKPDDKKDLISGEEITYNISIKKEQNISESIKILSVKNNITKIIPIEIKYIDLEYKINQTVNNSIENNLTGEYYCQELGGKECLESQECLGQLVSVKNTESCCIGKCSLIKEDTQSSSWIGYLIIIIAIGIIIFVFIRYKKVKPQKTILEKTLNEENQEKK